MTQSVTIPSSLIIQPSEKWVNRDIPGCVVSGPTAAISA